MPKWVLAEVIPVKRRLKIHLFGVASQAHLFEWYDISVRKSTRAFVVHMSVCSVLKYAVAGCISLLTRRLLPLVFDTLSSGP